MSLPNQTYIDTYISDGLKEVLCIKNFYDTILTTNSIDSDHIIRIPIDDFFIKHRKELENSIQYMTLPEKYFYKPKTLSYELYGTPELWLSLLRVNNMSSISKFHLPVVKFYNPNDVKELINIFFKRENKIL